MTTRTKDMESLAERARAVGFLVTKTRAGYRVNGPTGETAGFPANVSDRRTYTNALKALNGLGLEEREAKIAAKAEADRKKAIKADRDRNDAKAVAAARNIGTTSDVTWMFARHDFPEVRLVNVTPELAERMLERCTVNRPKKREHTAGLRGSMEDDRFVLTHQGVAFDTTGEFIDGQHRCQAIVDSGCAQLLWVFVGIDPRAVDFIDTHVKRTGADSLSMGKHKVPNATSAAALAKFVYTYDHAEPTEWARFRMDNELLRKEHASNADLYAWAVREARSARYAYPGFSATHIGAVIFIARRAGSSESEVDRFLHGFRTGEDLSSGDPLLALRRLAKDYSSGRTAHRRIMFAQVLLAWNAFTEGRRLPAIVWRLDDRLPPISVRK